MKMKLNMPIAKITDTSIGEKTVIVCSSAVNIPMVQNMATSLEMNINHIRLFLGKINPMAKGRVTSLLTKWTLPAYSLEIL